MVSPLNWTMNISLWRSRQREEIVIYDTDVDNTNRLIQTHSQTNFIASNVDLRAVEKANSSRVVVFTLTPECVLHEDQSHHMLYLGDEGALSILQCCLAQYLALVPPHQTSLMAVMMQAVR